MRGRATSCLPSGSTTKREAPLATVTDLFIEPGHRRQGYGRGALRFVTETCRALGVRGIELQVETHNAAGQALYRGFGFREHTRIPMFLSLT